jgi:hypothetical protein
MNLTTTLYNKIGSSACIACLPETYAVITNKPTRYFKSFLDAANYASSQGYTFDCSPRCVLDAAKRLAPRMEALRDLDGNAQAGEFLDCINDVISNFRNYLAVPSRMSAANEDLRYFKTYLKEHGF